MGSSIDLGLQVALETVKRRMEARFGQRFVSLILYGSQARGDARPDSDVDVAVILKGPLGRVFPIASLILDDTHDLLLESGLSIHPMPIEDLALEDPVRHSNPALVREIRRDGIVL